MCVVMCSEMCTGPFNEDEKKARLALECKYVVLANAKESTFSARRLSDNYATRCCRRPSKPPTKAKRIVACLWEPTGWHYQK